MENKKFTFEIDVSQIINEICVDILKNFKKIILSRKSYLENDEKRHSISQAYISIGKIEAFDEISKDIDTYIKVIKEG